MFKTTYFNPLKISCRWYSNGKNTSSERGSEMRKKLFKVKRSLLTAPAPSPGGVKDPNSANYRLETLLCGIRRLFQSFSQNQQTGGAVLNDNPDKPVKVSVVGVGSVGMAIAFSLLTQGICKNLALVDSHKQRLLGETLDLQHGSTFIKNAKISCGTDYSVTAGSKICIIAAGVRQRVGETRLDLVNKNTEILKEIVPQLVKYSPNTILIVTSNPVDILTYVTWKVSGLPKHRVIGSGTHLDSARFRYQLSKRLEIAPTSCHGYIIGEHGDTSVPVWSGVNIAGVRLIDLHKEIGTEKDKEDWKRVHSHVVNAGYKVVKLKGYTSWAIGLSVTQLAETIISDSGAVHPVSTYIKGEYGIPDEVFLSLPCVLDNTGVLEVVRQPLTERELAMLRHSADVMAKVISTLNL